MCVCVCKVAAIKIKNYSADPVNWCHLSWREVLTYEPRPLSRIKFPDDMRGNAGNEYGPVSTQMGTVLREVGLKQVLQTRPAGTWNQCTGGLQ